MRNYNSPARFSVEQSPSEGYNSVPDKSFIEGGILLSVLSQLSSPVMYLICGGLVAFVAAVCVVFAVRAWRAGKAIGMSTAVLRRVVTFSASFSVLPAVGILLGVIALSGALGIPWPWLRLSVIGALHYETQVAQGAAEQVGRQRDDPFRLCDHRAAYVPVHHVGHDPESFPE